MSCDCFFYINRGFLSGVFCLSLGFVTVLLLGRAWSSGGRWLRVTLSLPGPCRGDGHSAVAQLCLCRGPSLGSLAQILPSVLHPSDPGVAEGGAGLVFVPRGWQHPWLCSLPALFLKGSERLESPTGARADSGAVLLTPVSPATFQ